MKRLLLALLSCLLLAAVPVKDVLQSQLPFTTPDLNGAYGDGTHDDTAAIQAAMAVSGRVELRSDKTYLIDSNLTITDQIAIVGPHDFVGAPYDYSTWSEVGGALILNPTKKIIMWAGSSIKGVLIYRKGMSLPATNSSAFTGDAITVRGKDVHVTNSMILGFNKAVVSTCSCCERLVVDSLYHDNNNGIEISGAWDIDRIRNCHAWPYATQALAGGNSTRLERSGIAYYLHDQADFAMLTDDFEYGYATGYDLSNVANVSIVNCSTDSPTGHSSNGVLLENNSYDTSIIGLRGASKTQCIFNNTNVGMKTNVQGSDLFSCGTHGILVTGGDINIHNNIFRHLTYGISTASASSRITVEGNMFSAMTGYPFFGAVDDRTFWVGKNDYGDWHDGNSTVAGTILVPTLTSANPLKLPSTGDLFHVSGTNNFALLSEGWANRQVVLIFDGILTVSSTGGAPGLSSLVLASPFTTATRSTLSLRHDGIQWYEVGRKQ